MPYTHALLNDLAKPPDAVNIFRDDSWRLLALQNILARSLAGLLRTSWVVLRLALFWAIRNLLIVRTGIAGWIITIYVVYDPVFLLDTWLLALRLILKRQFPLVYGDCVEVSKKGRALLVGTFTKINLNALTLSWWIYVVVAPYEASEQDYKQAWRDHRERKGPDHEVSIFVGNNCQQVPVLFIVEKVIIRKDSEAFE